MPRLAILCPRLRPSVAELWQTRQSPGFEDVHIFGQGGCRKIAVLGATTRVTTATFERSCGQPGCIAKSEVRGTCRPFHRHAARLALGQDGVRAARYGCGGVNGSRTVYVAHLRFAGDPARVRPVARALARWWLVGQIGDWPDDADSAGGSWSPAPGEAVTCRLATAGGESYWEVVWRYPHDRDPTLRWSVVVLVGDDGDEAWAQVRYGLEAAEGCDRLSGWVEYDTPRPELARILVDELAAVDAGRRLRTAPMSVVDDAGIDELVQVIRRPMLGSTRR